MEVLNHSAGKPSELALVGDDGNLTDLGGRSLIQTVVSLTELPEPLMHQEISEILELSGHRSESLTLEQLRAAMLSYLESIQADFAEQGEEPSINDVVPLKTPVVLE